MKFLLHVCLLVGLGVCASIRAEEKIGTPPLTSLSSTTISGYVDTSSGWTPPTTNVSVTLPNGTVASVTPRDLSVLRWAVQHKDFGFVRSFVRAKEQTAPLDADKFDARLLPYLIRFSQLPKFQAELIIGHRASAF